jgi:hypothetical protein
MARQQGWISRGIHGLPKVLLAPAIPYNSMPYMWQPLKQPNSYLRGLPPEGSGLAAVLLHPWILHAIHICMTAEKHDMT